MISFYRLAITHTRRERRKYSFLNDSNLPHFGGISFLSRQQHVDGHYAKLSEALSSGEMTALHGKHPEKMLRRKEISVRAKFGMNTYACSFFLFKPQMWTD